MTSTAPIRVMCVDDNSFVSDGIKIKLSLEPGFEWVGALDCANLLVEEASRARPDVVLLDLDMPDKDALVMLEELTRTVPEARTIILSGHLREDHINRALEAGAWGYVSKNDGPDQVVACIRQVAAGRFAFSPSVLGGRALPIA